MENKKDLVLSIRLSLQRALLGEVFTCLRAVVFSITGETVDIRFYVDGPINEEDAESASCVETEVIADYEAHYNIFARCIRLDSPEPIGDDGVWVYKRREMV